MNFFFYIYTIVLSNKATLLSKQLATLRRWLLVSGEVNTILIVAEMVASVESSVENGHLKGDHTVWLYKSFQKT